VESHPVILRNINSFSKRNPLDTNNFDKDSLHLMDVCEYNGAPIERNTGHMRASLDYSTRHRLVEVGRRPLSHRVPGGADERQTTNLQPGPGLFTRTESRGAHDKQVFGGRL
jgi:hypothetical protein